jgi:CheY-like chemotaxis protein
MRGRRAMQQPASVSTMGTITRAEISALQVLQSSRPLDLLITDVGLPSGMNGRQLADAARNLRPDLNVLGEAHCRPFAGLIPSFAGLAKKAQRPDAAKRRLRRMADSLQL